MSTRNSGQKDLAVWQLAGGPTNRSYADVFLRHGVALIGPGDAGQWESGRDEKDFEGSFARRFAEEMDEGDVLLLRTGQRSIHAIGVVASEYLYLPQFDDVNGWDLQHARRVRWCELPRPHTFEAAVFGGNPPRCSRVRQQEVIYYARRFLNSPPTEWQKGRLPGLPPAEPPLTDIPNALRLLVAEAADLAPLYRDRSGFGEEPSEDEVIAHFVVPLLRALGWPPELIAMKWRHLDVAVFDALPRTPEHCRLVIEAKRFARGVEGALGQARGYANRLGVQCDVVVTDGIRYRLYSGDDGYAPAAYANLLKLKQPATALFERIGRR